MLLSCSLNVVDRDLAGYHQAQQDRHRLGVEAGRRPALGRLVGNAEEFRRPDLGEPELASAARYWLAVSRNAPVALIPLT